MSFTLERRQGNWLAGFLASTAVFGCMHMRPLHAATSACTGPTPSSRAAVERYIRQSEDEWAKSVTTGDASTVKRIMAEDIVWVLDGRVLDKKTAVAEAEGPVLFLSNTTDYVHIRFFDKVAVAQGSETWTNKGGQHGKFLWTDTWANRDSCWQIVAAQDTAIPSR
jgi:hypothetical protein